MIKILFTIFLVFILLVFLFGFSVLRALFGGLFGTKPQSNRPKAEQQKAEAKTRTQQTSPFIQKKIIDPNEGEYVEYEEIKD
ncbi:MAG: DUF4834 family protein [Candidatus Azobacteroides sp.]|nr:DUF4834 family protein [Candidatus Azobacteroides sp.]